MAIVIVGHSGDLWWVFEFLFFFGRSVLDLQLKKKITPGVILNNSGKTNLTENDLGVYHPGEIGEF